MLRDTSVTVQEIAPPWVDTDLIKKSGDPRAMPLPVFIEKTMAKLATDAEEVIVDEIRALRDNPGSGEHALINAFNLSWSRIPSPSDRGWSEAGRVMRRGGTTRMTENQIAASAARSAGVAPASPAPSSLLPPCFLALGTFAIGTEGFMIAPLLPTIAGDLRMSLSATAMLVVVFTLVLSLSSPVSTVMAAGLRRRSTLLVAMTLFTAGNIVAAMSSSFATLMIARILMAVASGLYVPGANSLAGVIVAPEKRGRALAIVSGGMTIAIALGLPLGAWVGHAFGWRSTFLAVAIMGCIAIIGILSGVRPDAGSGIAVAGLRERLGVIRQPAVLRLLGITLFWSIGAYTAYPYYRRPTLSGCSASVRAASARPCRCGASPPPWASPPAGSMNDRFGSDRVARASLVALGLSFVGLAVATGLAPPLAIGLVLASIALWGFSVWSSSRPRWRASSPPGRRRRPPWRSRSIRRRCIWLLGRLRDGGGDHRRRRLVGDRCRGGGV